MQLDKYDQALLDGEYGETKQKSSYLSAKYMTPSVSSR
mgnify:CR=1 FL=1